jgi:outer membrane protein assembly factor BamB
MGKVSCVVCKNPTKGIALMLALSLLGFRGPEQVTHLHSVPSLSVVSSTVVDQLPQGVNSTIRWSKASLQSDNVWLTVNSSSFSIFINRQVRALDLNTGRWAWLRVLDGFVNSAVADEKRFLVATGAGSLYMLDALSGQILWKFSVPTGQLQTHPQEQNEDRFEALSDLKGFFVSAAIADLDRDGRKEVLYLIEKEGKLGFLDALNGQQLAEPYTLPARDANSITVIDRSLIVIDLGEFLYGFTGKPGSLHVAWRFRKLGRTNLVGDIGAYDLDGDGKQEILVGGTGAIYVLNQSGKLVGSEFKTTDTTIAIQGAQLRSGQQVIVALHMAREAQDGNLFVLSPEGRLLWKFTNPHVNRFVFIFLPTEAPYPILSAPLIVDLDRDGTSETLLSSGGRLYLLDANGRLLQTLDLSPHDSQQNNIFAEAIASPVLYQQKIWVIASEIQGEVKSKTQRGDFFVKDMLFGVSF